MVSFLYGLKHKARLTLGIRRFRVPFVFMLLLLVPSLWSCTDANFPAARNANIPSPTTAEPRPEAVNEKADSVIYLPLGSDVLVPETIGTHGMPEDYVGPYELRSETLAGALQLILADYEVPLAFATDEGLNRTITVANLQGPLNKVVDKVCGLADLYCSYEDGILVIKDTQTFTVTLPPIGGETDVLSDLSTAIGAITGSAPITESSTRTIIYEATNRTAEIAERYFQRLRANTALIVFEVYIWEVSLDSGNATGVNWSAFREYGKFMASLTVPGGITNGDFTNPVSIGLPTTQTDVGTNDIFEFLSQYGAVKTISQPQITVLSGASASLRAADTINYVSSLNRTIDDGQESVSTETDSVDTGFTLTIESAWDNATVYGTIDIDLQEFQAFDLFDSGNGTSLSLPRTVERELSTQIRIRPGDSLLIGGLVREQDQFDTSGPGLKQPVLPTSRSSTVTNNELVFLLKPRVIVYTDEKPSNTAVGAQEMRDVLDHHDAAYSGELLQQNEKPKRLSGNVSGASEQAFPGGTVSGDVLDPSVKP